MQKDDAVKFLKSIATRFKRSNGNLEFVGEDGQNSRCYEALSALNLHPAQTREQVVLMTRDEQGPLTVLADLGINFPGSSDFLTKTPAS